MQITCAPHSERQSVLTIFCDGSPWRDVHTAVFGRRPTWPQGCSSFEEWEEEFSAFEYRQAKNYAIRRLSLQGMFSTALARAMKERLVSEKAVGLVIEEMVALGFINDDEWAASFVRGQGLKKVGPRAIAQKLMSKGVKGERLEAVLEQSKNPSEQKELIFKLLKSRYSRRDLSDFKEKQKVVASLVRRGFDFSLILSCLKIDN